LLASTTDEFYLVAHGKVAPFAGDLADYYQWLQNDAKAQQPVAEPASNGAAQRKDQKRLEADLRNLTRGLKQSIEKLEKQQHQLEAKLVVLEEKLADSNLYDPSRKTEMTQVLAEQTKFKAELATIEEQWFEAQELLEQQTNDFWNTNAG